MKIKHIDGEILKKMFIQGASILNKNREVVDSLNVFPVPDGDTGTNMSLTMDSAINEISKVQGKTVHSIAKAAANGSLMGARGNSGVILSQILRGFEKGCQGKEILTIKDFANALKNASDTAYRAVMKPIEGTILTIIKETGKKAYELANKNIDFNDFFYGIIRHAEASLERTPELLDVLKQAGVVDAGGKGLIFILKGFYEVISGKEDIDIESDLNNLKIHDDTPHGRDIKFSYCTEFIVQGKSLNPDNLKEKIKNLGDSLLVVGDENLVKVHIHTNNPGKIIEYGLDLGELINIKIDNMKHQHRNKVFDEKVHNKSEAKKYGLIAVAMGEGLLNILNDLNVDKVITGGQTMNPSTEDLLKAVNEINAENIFIFPNNSNIVLAANQAKELSKKNVIVIPTKTIPQGITSIIEFDPSASIEENTDRMSKAIESVKTIQITYSVRDSNFNGLTIKKGDILGILDGKISTVGNSVNSVALEAVNQVLNNDYEILTIYYGEEIDEEEAKSLATKIQEKYPDLDVEIYFGGQPLYYYIFSVE